MSVTKKSRCRLGLTADEYTRISKVLRDATQKCKLKSSHVERAACIEGVAYVVEAMNEIGFIIERK